MNVTPGLEGLPLSVRVLLAVAVLLAVNQLFAVYLESAVAASFGWPLIFLTAAALVVALLDGVRRGLGRLLG